MGIIIDFLDKFKKDYGLAKSTCIFRNLLSTYFYNVEFES